MSEPPTSIGSPEKPTLPWRLASTALMGSMTMLSRGFLYGFNDMEVHGLGGLLRVLDRRRLQGRERGLITVCNHVGVYVFKAIQLLVACFIYIRMLTVNVLFPLSRIDDPLIWGILPLKYAFDGDNNRWGLGAHDICFKNK